MFRSKRGQNTSEYIILLVLVVLGVVGVFGMFGTTLKAKVAQISNAISGDTTKYEASQKQVEDAASKASSAASEAVKMSGPDKSELDGTSGSAK